MRGMLSFGDIFELGDYLFVFLHGTKSGIYAARIINKGDISKLERQICQATYTDTIAYFFVTLTTAELEGKAAYFRDASLAGKYRQTTKSKYILEDGDKQNLLQEIKNNLKYFPGELKDYINSLD